MVVKDYCGDTGELLRFREDIRAYLRVLLHQLPLLVVQLVRLQQYPVGNAYLTNVVEVSGDMYFLRFAVGKPQLHAQKARHVADPAGMISSVGVARVQRGGYAVHEFVVFVIQLTFTAHFVLSPPLNSPAQSPFDE